MGVIREPGPRPSKEPRGYVQGPEDPIQGAPLTTKYVSIEVHQFIYMRITRENTVFYGGRFAAADVLLSAARPCRNLSHGNALQPAVVALLQQCLSCVFLGHEREKPTFGESGRLVLVLRDMRISRCLVPWQRGRLLVPKPNQHCLANSS